MHFLRHTTVVVLAMGIVVSGFPMTAHAEMTMTMTLAPHCTSEDRTTCPAFEVANGSSIKTGKLAAGDILDLDVVVSGPEFGSVRSVRSWLTYEPSVLEYRSVELTKELPSPSAGEQTADAVGNVVKIGGSTDSGLSGNNVAVARVTFRVLSTTQDAVISFNDFQADGTGHTSVNGPRGAGAQNQGALPDPPCISSIIGCRGTPQAMLSIEPSTLTVTLAEAAGIVPTATAAQLVTGSSSSTSGAAASSSSVASTADTSSSAAATTTTGDSTFGILQVQGVKVTTRDTMVFIGWNELRSAGIKGYNVYYSTVSGRYIQRHSVPKTETSLTLRNLPPDTTYYFAVRAVNAQDQESVFSQEVSVMVGRPETASVSLTAQQTIGLDDDTPEGNPMEIHGGRVIRGETGMSDILFMVFGVSALIGTAFAFRRQMAIHTLMPHAV